MYCLERGIPLPSYGSFQFKLLMSAMERRRAEKVAFAKFIATLIRPITGLSVDDTVLAVADYAEEIHQLTYNYDYETVRSKMVKVHKKAGNEDKRLLEIVSKL